MQPAPDRSREGNPVAPDGFDRVASAGFDWNAGALALIPLLGGARGGFWPGHNSHRRIFLPRRPGDDLQRLRRVRRGDDRHAWFDDPGLFRGDLGACMAEPILVIELDVGDDTGERCDDVRRIKPATEAGLPNHQIALLLREITQRHDGYDLEECGGRRTGIRRAGQGPVGAA